MSRLTKTLRESMLKAVLDHAFNEKQAAANSVLVQCGEAIYQDIYGPYQDAMNSLPKNWLHTTSQITVAIAGQRHEVKISEQRPVGDNQRYWNEYAKLYVGDEQIVLNYQKAADVIEALKSHRNAMKREVDAILNSVHTFKKLWEIWPESKCILEKFETKPTVALLPAIQIEKVNSALGLPTDKEIAA